MYKAFNLILKDEDEAYFSSYKNIGQKIFNEDRAKVRAVLDNYTIANNSVLDGSQIQKDWFPEIECDIFISHSHSDENLALGLAGWLFENLKIKVFIDSSVWGYSDELLRKLDDLYCKNKANSYSYTLRNYSTSHVHMMLATALSNMIYKTECLFFLNTNKSNIDSIGGIITKSPWIYSELEVSRIVEKRMPRRFSKEEQRSVFSESTRKRLDINYKPSDISHLKEIDFGILENWIYRTECKKKLSHEIKLLGSFNPPIIIPPIEEETALDSLYKITE